MEALEHPVNRTILDALRAERATIEARGILLVQTLHASADLGGDQAPLLAALQTVVRGVPRRLAPAAALHVWSQDMAGGDIEIGWEAREAGGGDEDDPAKLLASGPQGDLLELAIAGLQEICRARLAHRGDPVALRELGGVAAPAQGVRRRFTILLPSVMNRLTKHRSRAGGG